MISNVYFSPKIDYSGISKLSEKICRESGGINLEERVAIKVHFGEKGNSKFVSPTYIKPIIDTLKKFNNNFFLTDANTLYKGMRVNATDHKHVAKEHGFYKLDSDILIADGEKGDYEETVMISGKIFSEAKIAKYIADSDTILSISHFKGHDLFSFSGTIKNLGMGCASRAGKLIQHSNFRPSVNENCELCMACIEECPKGAITEVGNYAFIDHNLCIGCAKCISVCDNKAIRTPWFKGHEVYERTVEYALATMKGKKGIFFNFINNITKHCDCAKTDSEIICEDIGVLASIDPVACDKAAYDLVIQKKGKDIFKELHGYSGTFIFDYAEEIGLGKEEYHLVEI